MVLVSDGAGATAEAAINAARAQFPHVSFVVIRHSGIRTPEQVHRVVAEAAETRAIVVHTVVLQSIRKLLVRECRVRLIPHFDLIGPLISHIALDVGKPPIFQAGVSRNLDDDYFSRIEAIQFTVQHDDGQHIHDIGEADIVLVGVSRSSKTPLSIYLSMRGWKVANIPIIDGVDPPDELFSINQRAIVALTIHIDRLVEIRKVRLNHLESSARGEYAEYDRVAEELQHFRKIVRSGYPWPVVDITGKSIEESASEVIAIIEANR